MNHSVENDHSFSVLCRQQIDQDDKLSMYWSHDLALASITSESLESLPIKRSSAP